MTTISPLVMTMPGNTGAVQGNAAGTASAAGGNAFGQMLVQVIGGTGAQAQTSALPNLSSLLAGLLAGMSSEESAAMLEGPDSEVLVKLLEQLADNPDLLEQHLGNEDMQAWLAQAALLLQGMQLLPAAVVSTEDAASLANQAQGESAAAPAMNAQQAQVVLKQFVQALNQHPDEIFLNQLQDKLAAILTKRSQPEQTLPVHTFEDGKAGANKSADVTFTVLPSTAASRLEMLAARHTPIQLAENGKGAQALPQEQAESGQESGDTQEGPFSTAPVNGRHLLDRAHTPAESVPVRAGQLAEDISKFMLGKLRVQTGNGITEARLSLTPEALGHVDVRLTLHNGQLVAQFAAQTAMGKDALESQLAQLRNMLQTQGIQVEKIEVAQSPSLQSTMFQDQRGQQQSRQPGSNNREQARDGNEEYAVEAAAILRREASEEDGFDVIA